MSGPEADILVGNALPLKNIPPGTTIHNIELRRARARRWRARPAAQAQLVAKEGDYALVKLPSGETRKVLHRLHGDDRAGRQHRPRECRHRQGGTHRWQGNSPD